jgi:hypothetical protein
MVGEELNGAVQASSRHEQQRDLRIEQLQRDRRFERPRRDARGGRSPGTVADLIVVLQEQHESGRRQVGARRPRASPLRCLDGSP